MSESAHADARGLCRFPDPGWLPGFLLALCLAACTTADPARTPRLERLPVAEPMAVAAPALSLEAIAAMARAGQPGEAVVAEWLRHGAQPPIGAAELIFLHEHGVSRQVLDALIEAKMRAHDADLATRAAELSAQCERRVAAATAQATARCAPGDRFMYPYGSFAYPCCGSGAGFIFGR